MLSGRHPTRHADNPRGGTRGLRRDTAGRPCRRTAGRRTVGASRGRPADTDPVRLDPSAGAGCRRAGARVAAVGPDRGRVHSGGGDRGARRVQHLRRRRPGRRRGCRCGRYAGGGDRGVGLSAQDEDGPLAADEDARRVRPRRGPAGADPVRGARSSRRRPARLRHQARRWSPRWPAWRRRRRACRRPAGSQGCGGGPARTCAFRRDSQPVEDQPRPGRRITAGWTAGPAAAATRWHARRYGAAARKWLSRERGTPSCPRPPKRTQSQAADAHCDGARARPGHPQAAATGAPSDASQSALGSQASPARAARPSPAAAPGPAGGASRRPGRPSECAPCPSC